MAAPKEWGYTREKPFNDELLVSWADHDVIKMLAKEMEERMLGHFEDRRAVAAYARACEDTVQPHHQDERDWIVEPRPGLVDFCKQLGGDQEPAALGPPPKGLPVSPNTILTAGFFLIIVAGVVFWMIRNL